MKKKKRHISNLTDARLYLRYVLVFWTEFTKRHTRLTDALGVVLEELNKRDGHYY